MPNPADPGDLDIWLTNALDFGVLTPKVGTTVFPYEWITGPIVWPSYIQGQVTLNPTIDSFTAENLPDEVQQTTNTSALNTNGAAANRKNIFMMFDLSTIPDESTILSATLKLYNSSTTTASKAHTVHSVASGNSAWVEGLTWNYKVPSTTRWAGDTGADGGTDAGGSVSGTDYSATQIGSFTYTANDPADTLYSISLTPSAVKTWLTANYGVEIIRSDASATNLGFRSNDYTGDYNKRPSLVITFGVPSLMPLMSRPLRIWRKRR